MAFPSFTSPLIEPIVMIGLVLQDQMVITPGQLMIGLENWKVPENVNLYVAMFYGPETTLGNNTTYDPDGFGGMTELNECTMLHEIVLDVMSFSSEARLRKQEILQALVSDFAQRTADQYQMRICQVPTGFIPAPTLEETKQLNRFRITFAVNALYRKVQVAQYYDVINPPEVTVDG